MQHKGMCKLLGLDYSIEYKRGSTNNVADALSRRDHEAGSDLIELNATTVLIPQWMVDLQDSYQGDQWVAELQNKVAQAAAMGSDKYTFSQGLFRYKNRLCVGNHGTWRVKLLKEMHDSNLGGHSGVLGTYQRVKKVFYWPKLKESVHEYVKHCEICQMGKGEHIHTPGLLQPLPIPQQAWTSISMDFISGLPKSEGKEVILVVVDRLTKYAHFFGLSHPFSAAHIAQVFLEGVYRLHGLPTDIVSDRDPIFTSLFWKELMSRLNIQLNFSTAYHPQSDGQTERVNQCVEGYLRCMVYNQQKNWHRWLALAEWWYNSSFHSSLKCTPFEALYGYQPPQLPMGQPPKSRVLAVEERLRERHRMLLELRNNLVKAQDRMKKFADSKRTERTYKVGTWVYLRMQPYRQLSTNRQGCRKLELKYYGPFEILERVGKVAYRLNLPSNSMIHPVFHISQLKARVNNVNAVAPQLPIVGPEGRIKEYPEQILERRMVKQGNQAVVQLLIKWSNRAMEDATWEDYEQLEVQFPDFILRDKDGFKGRGMSDTNLTNGRGQLAVL